jgi:hypothetical protein
MTETLPLKARVRATYGPDPDDPTPEATTRGSGTIDSSGTVQVFFEAADNAGPAKKAIAFFRQQMIDRAVRTILDRQWREGIQGILWPSGGFKGTPIFYSREDWCHSLMLAHQFIPVRDIIAEFRRLARDGGGT